MRGSLIDDELNIDCSNDRRPSHVTDGHTQRTRCRDDKEGKSRDAEEGEGRVDGGITNYRSSLGFKTIFYRCRTK